MQANVVKQILLFIYIWVKAVGGLGEQHAWAGGAGAVHWQSLGLRNQAAF